jgi:tetratricopeptide (TPR) repeat protein
VIGPGPRSGWDLNRGLYLLEAGRTERATALLERVAAAQPGDVNVQLTAGRALRREGRAAEAVARVERAVALAPSNPRPLYELAAALGEAGRAEEADSVLSRLEELKADHADGLYLRAALAAERGETDRAVRLLDLALAAGPSRPELVRTDPRFDPVRNAPAFGRVVQWHLTPDAFPEDET